MQAGGLPTRACRDLRECIPALSSLTVFYDPLRLQRERLVQEIVTLFDISQPIQDRGRTFEIPVIYGGEDGPDLDDVSANAGIARGRGGAPSRKPALLCLHAGLLAWLRLSGRVAAALRLPRRATPRARVPAGSVAIVSGHDRDLPAGKPWRLASYRVHAGGALEYGAARGAAAQARRPGALRARRQRRSSALRERAAAGWKPEPVEADETGPHNSRTGCRGEPAGLRTPWAFSASAFRSLARSIPSAWPSPISSRAIRWVSPPSKSWARG